MARGRELRGRDDFIYRPGSHAYLVWNTTRHDSLDRSPGERVLNDQQLILKATYAWRR